MKTIKPLVLLFTLGSIWGFFEVLHMSNGLVSAIGLLLLVFGRRMHNVPGSSVVIGLIVCFYKTWSSHFFMCQWAGIMSVALSFEVFASVILREQPWTRWQASLAGIVSTVLALPVFIIWVVLILQEPNWVEGGWDRILSYAVRNTLPGVIVSAVLGPIGLMAGTVVLERFAERRPALSLGLYSSLAAALWLAATAFKFL